MHALRIIAVCAFASAVSLATMVCPVLGNSWQTIYSTDFSSDPGWTTNAPTQMYWDSANQRYHLQLSDGAGQYCWVDPFLGNPYSPSSSYKLEFDLTLTRMDWAGTVSFGLGDADMRPYQPTAWVANYGRGDGLGATIQYSGDTAGGGFPGGYDFLYDLNTPYHNEIVYDGAQQSLAWKVTRLTDSVVVADYMQTGVGTFAGLDRLCSSRVGYNYAPGATGEGYIDNVSLAAVPEPVTVVSAGIGLACLGAYLKRRNKAEGSQAEEERP